MCSINGVVKLKGSITEKEFNKFKGICERATNRGRDSFGYTAFSKGGGILSSAKNTGKFSNDFFEFVEGSKVLISNNRAEPTTEFVKDKKVTDVQPFTDATGRFTVVHNGTIANDKELKKLHGWKLETEVDSAVIPEVLNKFWDRSKGQHPLTAFKDCLKHLKGSFSLAVHDTQESGVLYLAVNYKPLFIERIKRTMFFSSLEEFLGDMDSIRHLGRNILQIPPYSVVRIDGGDIECMDLLETPMTKKKALVVCSGGLDSIVVAKKMIDDKSEIGYRR